MYQKSFLQYYRNFDIKVFGQKMVIFHFAHIVQPKSDVIYCIQGL